MNDFKRSEEYLLTALENPSSVKNRVEILYMLSTIKEKEGDWKSAYKYKSVYEQIMDTLFSTSKRSLIQVAERKYRNEFLQQSNELLTIKSRLQTIILIVTIIESKYSICPLWQRFIGKHTTSSRLFHQKKVKSR